MSIIVGTVRLLLLCANLLVGVAIVGIGYRLLGESGQLILKQAWSRLMLRALGIRLITSGFPNRPESLRGLVVSNHISFIDIFVIDAVMPCTFVSKSDVTEWPLIGWIAKRAGTIFIERGSRRAAHRTQEAMADHFHLEKRVAIFPEGTTSTGETLLPFHAALFQAAVETSTNVQCLSLSYLDNVAQKTALPSYAGDTTVFQCLWNTVTARGLQAQLHLLAPILPPHLDRRHLSHHAHQIVAHHRSGANTTVPIS